jgi:SAM-dependent methyltransferase
MHQTPHMTGTGNAAEFWNQDSQVQAFSATTAALPYELDLIGSAAAQAARTAPVEQVHVVGVGAGRELLAVRGLLPDAHVHGWDISDHMVQACAAFIEDRALEDMTVARADVVELTADDGPADVVVLVNAVLCYLDTAEARRRAFAALFDLVRPGGALAIVVHQRNGRPDWSAWFAARGVLGAIGLVDGGAGDRRIRHGGHQMRFHHYTPRELSGALRTAGFDDVDVESLRAWARRTGHRIPLRSPNPLMVTAIRPTPAASG